MRKKKLSILTASPYIENGLEVRRTPATSRTDASAFILVNGSEVRSRQWERSITRTGEPPIRVCTMARGANCMGVENRG